MEIKKVSFEVDASQIDIKPLLKKEFLELTMKPISTANPNRNNSWFTRESLEASLDSFKNKPILGYFENGDFVSHNGEWREDPETDLDYWDTISGKGERPLGLIRGDDEVKIIDDETTGLSWVVLTCALWTQYNYKQVKRLLQDAKRAKKQGGPTKNVSVEVDITDYEILPNGIMKINAFNLVGITILGSRNGVKVEPGIADAELSVVDIMGTELYEKQMQSLRMAYEKLDGSENNKEDFSKMENVIQENSTVENILESSDPKQEEVNTEENKPAEEGSQESAHFEENHNNETSEPEQSEENANAPTVHQNNEESHDDDDDDDEDEGEGNDEENGEHQDEEVHQNEEVSQDVVRDIGWLINSCSWNIDELNCSIGYYEANEEIQGREYILPVLRRLLAQAIANEKELAELMGKVAGEISEEEIQFENELCAHYDCRAELNAYNELLCKYNDLAKECEALKEDKKELECKFEEIEKAKEHAQFVEEAKNIIASAKLEEAVSQAFEKSCEDGSIASLDELKTQIGLKLYELQVAQDADGSEHTFDAPVTKPNTSAFIDNDANKTKKSKWDALREYNQK